MKTLDLKLNNFFGGKVVRKDLTNQVKGNAIVPTYVLEYLLGQYCATDDEETIIQGVETVKNIISKHFVHRDQSRMIQGRVRDKGSHRIIDKVSVRLNDRKDQYEASFANLGLKQIPISDAIIKEHQKLLSSGVWCILTLGYFHSDERDSIPWIIETLKPIQISNIDLKEFKEARKNFSKEEWIDVLMQTIGLNPEEFTFRSKLLQITRLVPFVENNYNLIELGPKGTGKSHIFSELSPHGILISGGEVSKAKLFVNNSSGEIGLVGYWDVVAYDEFAGKTKKVDRGLVDIMKNYMANKSFSRGTEVYGASASMVFVGNTDKTVPYMLKHSDLFEALPKDYYDTAFLDRMHGYLPGWEVQKLRNEMFTLDYGFIVDYLAEILKELRKEDRTHDYTNYFMLSESITTRDKTAIAKTFAGLSKVIYPHGDISIEEAKELIDFSIEIRKRVKEQLYKMDETFEEVDFSYHAKGSGSKVEIETLENLNYQAALVIDKEDEEEKVGDHSKPEVLTTKQEILKDNQTGVSYKKLFAAYLKNASNITLQDPYIRLPYQFKNLLEFCLMLSNVKSIEDQINLEVISWNHEEYMEDSIFNFEEMKESVSSMGINLTYRLEDHHDRYIAADNGWKITLGRGLDIFEKNEGRFNVAELDQTKRRCKSCELTYIQF